MIFTFLFSMALALSTLFAPLKADAAEKCSIGNLTNKCEYFKKNKDKPEIVLPDGKRFPNPAYVAPSVMDALSAASSQYAYDPKKVAEAMDKNLALQEEIIETLGEDYNSKFLLAVSSSMTASSIGLALSTPTAGVQVMVPWPPGRSERHAKMKSVPWSEFKSGFLDKLPEDKREIVTDRFKKMYANGMGAYGGLGGGMGSGGYSAGSKQPDRFTPPAPSATPQDSGAQRAKDIARAGELVQKAKALLLSELSQGKPYSSLSSDQKALYDKVNTIKYVPPLDPAAANNPVCAGDSVNAFYMPMNHTFTLCPGIISFPDSSLVMTIAHELGHSIDPCRCSHGFYTPDADKVAQLEANIPADQWTEDRSLILSLKASSRWSGEIGSMGNAALTTAIEKGLLKQEAAPVPWKRYPQAVPLACLKKQIGLRTVTNEMLIAEKRQQEREKKSMHDIERKSDVEIRAEVQKQTDNPDCRQSSFGYAEAGEAMADAWGAKVLGRYLEENPPKSVEEKIGAFSVHLAGNEICGKTDFSRMTNQRSHPFSRERVDDILMADHRVQKALDCKGDPKNICLRSMGTMNTPTVNRTSTVEPTEGQK